MAKDRSNMTVRVVPLSSREASDPLMGGTADERVAAVRELSELGWTLANRPFPAYTRATMPVVLTTLLAHAAD